MMQEILRNDTCINEIWSDLLTNQKTLRLVLPVNHFEDPRAALYGMQEADKILISNFIFYVTAYNP